MNVLVNSELFQMFTGRQDIKRLLGCFEDYIALAIFQPYRDLEAGDNQSLKS